MSSGIQERIAAALKAHDWWLAGNLGVPGMPDYTTYKCNCGWSGADPRAHTAAAVVAELHLTAETQIDYANIPSTPLNEAGGIEIRTERGQGWAECELCGCRESGCYAELVEWADDHTKEVHDQQPYPMRRRWISEWEKAE